MSFACVDITPQPAPGFDEFALCPSGDGGRWIINWPSQLMQKINPAGRVTDQLRLPATTHTVAAAMDHLVRHLGCQPVPFDDFNQQKEPRYERP